MSSSDEIGDYAPNVAIVTGAARGIGRTIALRLADDGFDVTVNDLPAREQDLQEVVKAITAKGRKGLCVTGDVSLEADVDRLVAETAKELGSVDVMIANAGISGGGRLTDLDMALFDRVIAVNLRGVMLCYKYAARQMIKQKRGGRLIGASSIFGKRGVPYNQPYCSSKFAVRGMSHSVAKEMIPYKITCNTYAPGVIVTPLTDFSQDIALGGKHGSFVKSLIGGKPDDPDASPEVIASLVSYLCKPEAYFITGESVSACGGLSL